MNRFITAIFSYVISALFCFTPAYASPQLKDAEPTQSQATQRISLEGHQVSIGYYRIKPGKEDEWLALYKDYHLKFLQALTLNDNSTRLYKPQAHKPGGWDIAVVSVFPRDTPRQSMGRERSIPVIIKLFGSLKSFIEAENRRWELTESHWDEGFSELSLDDSPLTLRIP